MMRSRNFILLLAALFMMACSSKRSTEGTLFVWGSDINMKFTQYVASLTGKENPHILYLPTASGDNPDNIRYWENICKNLGLESHIMRVWVDSWAEQTFEQMIEAADAIIIGGGNTLNMLGIWQAQGIDRMLIEALQRGTIVAGGSAGSICWFESGISDSRPSGLSAIEGLGELPFSNCPHYGDEAKRTLYHQMLESGEIGASYAMDDKAGILFRDGEPVEAVSFNPDHKAYHVGVNGGKAEATEIPTRLLLAEGAIAEQEYSAELIGKSVNELQGADGAVGAFVAKAGAEPTTRIESLMMHKNLAAIVHDQYMDLFGSYCIRYLYNDNGTWQLLGEDLGDNVAESEVLFREKATIILRQAEERFNN